MKKFFVLVMLVAVLVACFSTTASAANTSQKPQNDGWARIRYAGNGRYLDIPAENFYDNGTQLQVWDKAYGNQNQIFYFHDTGKGWQISSHLTDKVVEVRDSSHEDYAQVAQWDRHSLACARWNIIPNEDGTVSFQNVESGLYLNVCGGGDASNGTKIIQYHNDGTIAMKFYIEVMEYSDILSATFDRYTKISEVKWTKYTPIVSNILNDTGWQYQTKGNYYYPSVNQEWIFESAEFLSPNTVANMLKEKSYNSSTWNQIQDAISGEMTEDGVSTLLAKLGFDSVPGIGYAIGILQALWESQDSTKWNEFVNAAKIDPYGRCSGVIVYTYYEIAEYTTYGPLNNGTTYWGKTRHIHKVPHIKYATWTGDNFYEVCKLPVKVIDGRWWYYFK